MLLTFKTGSKMSLKSFVRSFVFSAAHFANDHLSPPPLPLPLSLKVVCLAPNEKSKYTNKSSSLSGGNHVVFYN